MEGSGPGAPGQNQNSLSGCVDEQAVGEDDRQPLEEDGGRAGVVLVLQLQHVRVKVLRRLGQAQLEPGEQRRVVQGPLRRVLETQRPVLLNKVRLKQDQSSADPPRGTTWTRAGCG